MGRLLVGLILCILWLGGAAHAESRIVSVGGEHITLTLPSGYCFLSNKDDRDRPLLEVLRNVFKGNNKLLAAFADCQQLKGWRTARQNSIRDYGQYLAPKPLMHRRIGADQRMFSREICKYYKSQGSKIWGEVDGLIRNRIEDVVDGMTVGEQRFLGVLDQDENGCYVGLVQRLQSNGEKSSTIAGVYASAVSSGKVVTINMYLPYRGPVSVQNLLAQHKTFTEQFLDAQR